MIKTITTFTAQLVTFESTSSFKEVIARLDSALNKEGSKQIMVKLGAATSKGEVEELVNGTRGTSDLLYFFEINHHKWLNVYEERQCPAAVIYTIGNPIIAHTIIKHDIRAAYNIPPRLLVLENPDRSGVKVIYHLPSSVMALTNDTNIRAAAEYLDSKLDKLVTSVLQPLDSACR
ncbi:hypothetical protein AX17_000979 [Amanita inopinata Kibby_2008]|nr:hypothetical protein AX17_000979 [Amanita inopinata Kibby_2008]